MGDPSDKRFMRMAIRLARRGLGRTRPNPPVGAVVVLDGTVVGRGYHRKAGTAHGEAAALVAAGDKARGATLYVTLEPCAHHGRTPPCTEAVLAAGIRRVVIGTRDPNPKVVGQGIERLREAGLDVAYGIEQRACDALIAGFRRHASTGLPFLTLKLATSLDGRIATVGGESKWITNARSRRHAHRLRNEHDAILVGAETVRRDDPELTCRLRGGRNPLRVILDGRLRIPLTAKVLDVSLAPTLVIAAASAPARRVAALRERGVEVVCLAGTRGVIPFKRVLQELGRRDITSVLVEGGAAVAASALQARAVDQLLMFMAPILIGGDGKGVLGPLGVRRLRQVVRLGTLRVKRFAEDLLIATEVSRT